GFDYVDVGISVVRDMWIRFHTWMVFGIHNGNMCLLMSHSSRRVDRVLFLLQF
ncbi:hypothetical protein RYX36_007106, partial [Vicia faba]